MKIERTKNVVRSTVFGFASKVINIVLPFVSRTVILYVLGDQYLGLSSLFVSILSFLSLAELGMGSAMVYSMYKPIAQNDNKTICALLNMYRRFYRLIGCVITLIGLAVLPLLNLLVKEELPPDVNIYWLYLIYLLNTVLSYFLFAYKLSVLQAYQRNDIESKISMFVTTLSYIVMLTVLLVTKNYYAYIICMPLFTIITNIIRLIYVNRHYPQLKPAGEVEPELKKSITKKVSALIGTKLNTVVINAADNIVIAAFFSISTIAMYGNYYYILSSITGFLGICYGAMTAGLGNSLQTETIEKNYNDFLKFSFINAWLIGWCSICFVCLYQPFMLLWVGEELMFPFYIAVEFAIYFYVYQIRKIPVVYKDAAGIWWEDRFRPYVCMSINVVLNLILVQIIGVSGIILSTVISLCVSIPWENYMIFKHIFHCNSKTYYLKMSFYAFITVLICIATYSLCSLLDNSPIAFFAKLGICLVVPNLMFILLYHKLREFSEAKALLMRIVLKNKKEQMI